MKERLGARKWATLLLVGLFGQFAWTIENMYFNVFLYKTISTDPGYIAAMVGWSAAAATLTTLLMGALSDRVGKRKVFIAGGYILWGLSTAAFGYITPENAARLFPAANATLRYALSVGGDEAYLLSDRALAGSDAYATAVALSAAVRKLEGEKGQPFDLILCGKQASDSDTSLVTPALAELLDRPHTTAVVDFEMTEGAIVATREMDKGTETLRLTTPAVLSVSKTVFPARYPNLKLKIQANRKQIPVLDGAALALNPADVGASGSLTDVGSSFIPERDKSGVKIDGANGAQAAETLMGMLLDRHVI